MTPSTATAPEHRDRETALALLEADSLLSAPAALDHVTLDLGGRRVLDDVTFPIERGKINVIIGPSGVGKTTIVKCLLGLLQPTYGRSLADGRELRRLKPKEEREFRNRTSVMFQGASGYNAGLFGSLSAFDNVAFPLRDRTKMSEAEIAERVWHYLDAVGMRKRADGMPQDLSGGELRRIALARCMVSESELVVMDDVESGIDHVRLRGMIELISSKQAEQGNTYLITTNEPEVARRLADYLIVVRAGAVVEAGVASKILRQQDSFGRRLMAGDPASGLAMLDEVGDPQFARAKDRAEDFQLQISLLFMAVALISSLLWLYYTFTAT